MMLRFPYQSEPLVGAPPPTLPAGSTARWRPYIPVRIIGPTGRSRYYSAAGPSPPSVWRSGQPLQQTLSRGTDHTHPRAAWHNPLLHAALPSGRGSALNR